MSAAATLSILSDNTSAGQSFLSEWGFSAALRLPTGRLWIWDAGQSAIFLQNGSNLGLDLAAAAGLALSHGHYDHTGGIPELVQAGFHGPIFAHPNWATDRYSVAKREARAIGAPAPARHAAAPFLEPVPCLRELDPGLFMITDISRRKGCFEAVAGFSFDPDGMRSDPVVDDGALILMSGSGPVVLLGCCHSGVRNTLLTIRDRLGLHQIHAVVGGLHLHAASENAVRETARTLLEFNIQKVHPGHCTGDAFSSLESLLPEKVFPLGAGRVLPF